MNKIVSIKRGFAALLFGCFASSLSAQSNWLDFPKDQVMVVAHRGDWRNAPENSIKAIEYALDMGVDIVEVDVKRSADGVLYLLHDVNLDRTTTLSGPMAQVNSDVIDQAFLKNGAGMPTKQRIPTLKETLDYVKGKPLLINLDKAWDYFDQVMELVDQTQTASQVILKGSEEAAVLKAKYGEKLDQVIYMPMIWPEDYSIYKREKALSPLSYTANFIKEYRPLAFEVIIKDENSSVDDALKLLQAEGILIWINALWPELCAGHDDEAALEDPEAHWGWILSKGARIIQTDRPKELIDYLKSKNLKHQFDVVKK